MVTPSFETAISELVWDTRYRYRSGGISLDACLADTWRRVARTLASVEPAQQKQWEEKFYRVLEGFRFLPGGRIVAGAGTAHNVTLFNCFVMGRIGNSLESIFDSLKEGALTMQQGGGVGYDFSTLHPAETGTGITDIAPGPVAFMRIWDSMCDALLSMAARRGAMMATLRCDHPDIEAFIDAKRNARQLRNFNLSVLISDDFMQAVLSDDNWPLLFPAGELPDADRYPERIDKNWQGAITSCAVLRHIRARTLWDSIIQASYDTAEPGVLFIDRINQMNNLGYREQISATNPCGEIPLPPYGACDLGSINLTQFVRKPFGPEARLDLEGIQATAAIAVRMLDNVINLSRFPLPAQQKQSQGSRRIGLGITGLADTFIMLGLHYAKEEARQLAARIMESICHAAYRTSIELAREKGAFPFLETEPYLSRPFIQCLPSEIKRGIVENGIRNSHLIAVAPTGTISLLANNISSGIEPVFDFHYRRRIRATGKKYREYELTDYALRHWETVRNNQPLPAYFVNTTQLAPEVHLKMLAAIQPYVDNAISKTINVPEQMTFDEFRSIYHQAWQLGLKGCTAYRPTPVRGEVVSAPDREHSLQPGTTCCSTRLKS